MRKKILILSLILILTNILIIVFTFSNQKSLTSNSMFALRMDGKTINEFPEKGKYFVQLKCKNAIGSWDSKEWKLNINEIVGNVFCSIDFFSNTSSLTDVVEDNSYNTGDAGYRYNGLNPNNYIWFNNELWRIIGSVPTKVSEAGETLNLVKIIKAESIGRLASDEYSIWEDSNLYELLNSYYLGKRDATNTDLCYYYSDTHKAICDYSSVGLDISSYYGTMIKQVYWNTGETDVYNTVDNIYQQEILTQSTYANVGLLTISDYGYSFEESRHSIHVGMMSGNNWLFQFGQEHIILGGISNSGFVAGGTSGIKYGSSIRPVVYLDPSVYVVSGDGTEANPYQVGM